MIARDRPVVGVVHPGQMGAAIAAQAVRAGAHVLWCPAGRSPATAMRAEEAGLEPVQDLAALLARCQVVLSICPPSAAEELAGEVAGIGFGGIFVDGNAISPARTGRVGAAVTAQGGRFVDGAVIGPPPGDTARARLYLAGHAADVAPLAALFSGTAVEVVAMERAPGAASTLKMAFASYQKATRTLAAVAHALAHQHGVEDLLLVESQRMAGMPLAEPGYLPSVAARAWRWAPEMQEVAETLADSGLPDDLARATGVVLERWSADRDRWDAPLPDVLERLAAAPVARGGVR
jgi:3-hydroxyisobutyrate dehydrogenase-like beta-hydroxyacid dehydrogenase